MWLAEQIAANGDSKELIGSVTLAMRGDVVNAKPVVHWLVVAPPHRRQGIGTLLMSHLEAAAWDAGHRGLWLETHAAWESAAHFYKALGYQEVIP